MVDKKIDMANRITKKLEWLRRGIVYSLAGIY